MAGFRRKHKWNGWAGTPADLERAASLAREVVERWAAGEEVTTRLSMDIGGLDVDDEGLDQLLQMSAADQRKVNRISIDVETRYGIHSHVDLDVDPSSPAVSVQVRGPDRTDVEGLLHRLIEVLDEGAQKPRWYSRGWAFLIGWLLFMVLLTQGLRLVQSLGLAPEDGRYQPIEVFVVAFTFAGPILLAAALWWLKPNLQLLGRGERTRARRFRGAVWVLVLGVLGSLVAALVFALVED